ncbi:ribosome biogenesis ATPase Rix7p [Diutina catenulata]
MPRTLTESLDRNIYGFIQALLEEKTRANAGETALAKNVSVPEALEYCQRDFKLKRMKKAMLEKSIRPILMQIREEEADELASNMETDIGESLTIKEAITNDVNLVEDVDTQNYSNKQIVEKMLKSHQQSPEVDKKDEKDDKDERPRKKRRKQIDSTPPSVTLSSLGGMDEITTELMEVIGLPILHPEIYLSTGVQPPRGVLLYGPPGCGKTTVANALAGELQVPFFNISAPSIVSGMSGESEKKLRELFDEAKQLAPCLIFMDEIDAITPKRDGGAQREMERRIVAQLLTLMDELSMEKLDGKPVIVIGATNRPDSLDSALRRAGRFDREICLNVPNEFQREQILRSMTSHLRLEDHDFNYRHLAKLTPGYVGADLRALVGAAGVGAIKRILEQLSREEAMEVDQIAETVEKSSLRESTTANIIQMFLKKHQEPLPDEVLSQLTITYADFTDALPSVQPTAKREGFATVPDVSWAQVGALGKVRMELHMSIVQPIKKPELYRKVGISAPAGVLMWGPPGCGKTLLAKAVANESRANFISIKGPELLNKYVGESERAVRQVFARARASVPCIIFFDELDALVPRRDSSLSESSARVVNTLLTELDGLNDRGGVFCIGATNRPDMIDPAMLRPGRLDKTLYIELPSEAERLDILLTLVKANKTPLSSDVALEDVAAQSDRFSGADLSSLVREAGVSALKTKFFSKGSLSDLDASGFVREDEEDQGDIVVTQHDFANALANIKPSVSENDRARYERLSKKLGWSVMEKNDN